MYYLGIVQVYQFFIPLLTFNILNTVFSTSRNVIFTAQILRSHLHDQSEFDSAQSRLFDAYLQTEPDLLQCLYD
jgi:hypothetical protein